MPLSEHEQRILADIEARLKADDPKLARTVSTASRPVDDRRGIKLAVLGFVAGFVLLFVGIIVHIAWGILGFALMLVAAVHAGNAVKRLGAEGNARNGERGGTLQRYLDGAKGRRDEPER